MSLPFSQTTVAVASADVTIAGPNLKRLAITIGPPSVGTLLITFGRPATGTTGIRIPAGTQPKTFGRDEYGSALYTDIHAWNTSGADFIDVLDVFSP